MCREEMIDYIMENLSRAEDGIIQEIYWALLEQVG